MTVPPRKGSGTTPDRYQGPDGPEGKDRERVIPEPAGGDPLPEAKVVGGADKAAPAKPARDPAAEAAALAALESELAGGPAPAAKPAVPDELPAAKPAGPPAAKAATDKAATDKAATDKAAADKATAEKAATEKAAAAKKAAADKAKADAEAREAEEDANRIPPAPAWWKTLRADPPAHVQLALGIGLLGVVLLLWFLVTLGDPTSRIISPSKLPSPGEVFGSFGKLMQRDFVESVIDTLQRVFVGVGLAALVGVGVGVFAASNRGVGSAVAPLVIFLRSVPMGALIPLTLLLFADGERQKTMFIFLAIVPFVFSDTVKAISIVPERYVETAQTLGASRMQIIRKVLVPLALPDIITSLRFQLGLALGYIMLAEEINTEHGLGKLINGSQRIGPYEHVYLLLFVIAFIAFGIDYLLRTVQRGAFAWRKDL